MNECMPFFAVVTSQLLSWDSFHGLCPAAMGDCLGRSHPDISQTKNGVTWSCETVLIWSFWFEILPIKQDGEDMLSEKAKSTDTAWQAGFDKLLSVWYVLQVPVAIQASLS